MAGILNIRGAESGEYALQIIGSRTGQYTLEVHALTTEGSDTKAIFRKVATKKGAVHTYSIKYSKESGARTEVVSEQGFSSDPT